MNYFKLLSLLFILGIAVNTTAQKHVDSVSITKFTKFKPPAVKTYLGRNINGATVTVEEANQLITLPVKIMDAKNTIYTLSSYQFMYKKKSVIENEETGKRQSTFTTVADRFNAAPLPKVWQNNISGSIQKGEEFFFFDVLVKDKLGRIFFAPNLKISIQ